MADDKDLMKTALNYVIETLNHPKTKCLQPQGAFAALIACEKAPARASSHSKSALPELRRVLAEAQMRTIKGTLDEMLTFQTTLWWDVKCGHGKAIGVKGNDSPFPRMCTELASQQLRQGP